MRNDICKKQQQQVKHVFGVYFACPLWTVAIRIIVCHSPTDRYSFYHTGPLDCRSLFDLYYSFIYLFIFTFK